MPEEKVFLSEAADEDEDENEDYYSESFVSFQECLESQNLELVSNEIEINPDSMELKKSRKKALLEFRCRVEDSILSDYILGKNRAKFDSNLRDITLWGVPLSPSKGHQGTDIVLMKFLKAKDFKVSEAFNMLRRTLKWRREFNIDGICDEKFDSGLENLGLIQGEDKQGRPICYFMYNNNNNNNNNNKEFNKNLEGKIDESLRWKVKSMEKCMEKLRFGHGGVDSVLQVTDFKNSHGLAMKELRSLNKKSVVLFQENYPELIFRNIYINVPFWYFVSHLLQSKFISQRTKSKFIFARSSRVTQTLLKYIAPENIPVQYGGLKRENDEEFSSDDKVLGINVGAVAWQTIQIPVPEAGVTVIWDATVVGFEVTYKEEFIPDDDCSYNVLLQAEKKMKESARNSFYINEPGKIVITIDNPTSIKKKIFIRHKSKPTLPIYTLQMIHDI